MFCKDLRKNWRHAGCMWKPTENQIYLTCGRPPCLEFYPLSSHTLRMSASVPAALGHDWAIVSEVFLFCFTLLALLKEVSALMAGKWKKKFWNLKNLKIETKCSLWQERWSPSAGMWQETGVQQRGLQAVPPHLSANSLWFAWEALRDILCMSTILCGWQASLCNVQAHCIHSFKQR